eukprot:4069926-Alexandrium_andersonii.AAC.1
MYSQAVQHVERCKDLLDGTDKEMKLLEEKMEKVKLMKAKRQEDLAQAELVRMELFAEFAKESGEEEIKEVVQ